MNSNSSKTIFFLAPYPKGKAPSQRFRFEQYLSFLEEMGFNCTVYSFLSEKGWETIYKKGSFFAKMGAVLYAFHKRLLLLFKLNKADFLFIHREASHVGPPIFEWIISKVLRRKFIYDFDDAIWLPNYSEQNAKFERLKNYKKVNKVMAWADTVTAGNEYLKNYALQFNQNVHVLPTTIDTENHHNQKTVHSKSPVVIGWTGSHTTAQYLAIILPILKRLEDEFIFEFRVISNENPKLDLRNFSFTKWNKETEIKDLAEINIGIMPLKDDKWAKGKCGFKALQYMALEIPCVISSVGVNTAIIEDGKNGFLAEDVNAFYDKLKVLLQSQSLRESTGLAGRKRIIDQYSVNANKETYLALFK